MINIAGPFNSGVGAGGAGVATNNADSPNRLKGIVRGIYVKYNDSPPAGTTDATIATKGTNAPTETLLAIANAATNGWFYPKTLININTTGASVASTYELIAIDDYINVLIAGADNGDSIDVYILLEN